MARYVCTVCGEIYDEELEGIPFSELPDDWTCPLCRSPKSAFVLLDDVVSSVASPAVNRSEPEASEAPAARVVAPVLRTGASAMDDIHEMAQTGRSIDAAMETSQPVPAF